MSGQPTITKTRNTCFCHHCKQDGFKRSELNRWFLCAECAAIPGVKGYVKTSERGTASGSLDYWRDTLGQLHVITGDDVAPTATTTSSPTGNEFPVTRDDMLAAPGLDQGEKLYLLMLAEKFADHKTGANCYPSYQEQAAKMGLSVKQIMRLRRRVIAKGWLRVHKMRSSWRRTSDLYQFLRPATAKHGPWEGPVSHRRQGATLVNSLKVH